jgi:hypothetical protein
VDPNKFAKLLKTYSVEIWNWILRLSGRRRSSSTKTGEAARIIKNMQL